MPLIYNYMPCLLRIAPPRLLHHLPDAAICQTIYSACCRSFGLVYQPLFLRYTDESIISSVFASLSFPILPHFCITQKQDTAAGQLPLQCPALFPFFFPAASVRADSVCTYLPALFALSHAFSIFDIRAAAFLHSASVFPLSVIIIFTICRYILAAASAPSENRLMIRP